MFRFNGRHLTGQPWLAGLCLCGLLALAACAPATRQPEPQAGVGVPPEQRIDQLLAALKNAPPAEAAKTRLELADLLLGQNRAQVAATILADVDTSVLDQAGRGRWLELRARTLLQLGRGDDVITLLNAPDSTTLAARLPKTQQLRLDDVRADAFDLTGDHLASARLHAFVQPLIDDPERAANNGRRLWRSLLLTQPGALADALAKAKAANEQQWAGWLELAAIATDRQSDIDQQAARLDQWLQNHPDHPAHSALPGGLATLREVLHNRPHHVAVLLPFSGDLANAAAAVREGMLAAYYQALDQGSDVPSLEFLDTGRSASAGQLYQNAVDDGADLVVGPLAKDRVKTLFDQQLSVPALALNYIDDYGTPPPQLYQFGLGTSDEVALVVNQARLAGHSRALVVHSSARWSERTSRDFARQWQAAGGDIAAIATYDTASQISHQIRDALHINLSRQRAATLRQVIGERFEYSPHRRRDVDMVFIVAEPAEARSIKPLLAFYYAGALPVYATSNIYSGRVAPSRDNDLNGVHFADTPWTLEHDAPLHAAIARHIHDGGPWSKNLYAFGIDAYHLVARLPLLRQVPSSRYFGVTGTLSMNSAHRIVRRPDWGVFRNGRAEAVPTAAGNIGDDQHVDTDVQTPTPQQPDDRGDPGTASPPVSGAPGTDRGAQQLSVPIR